MSGVIIGTFIGVAVLVFVVVAVYLVMNYRIQLLKREYQRSAEALSAAHRKDVEGIKKDWESECERRLEKAKTDFDSKISTKEKEYQNKLKKEVAAEVTTARKEIRSQFETDYLQKEKELKDEYDEKERALRLELAEALDEGEQQLKETVEKVDEMLGERLGEIAAKNTLTFNCVCSPDYESRIPVPIDFTTENFFTCPKCGARYRVAINASPVLVSSVSNNQRIANIFSDRTEEGM